MRKYRYLGPALVFAATGLLAWPVHAQLVVIDPAVIARNAVTAALQQLLFNTQRDQRQRFEEMARRLSRFTSLAKYIIQETPEWRIHDFWTDAVLFAHDYHAALNYGDRLGTAYLGVVDPLLELAEGVPPNLTVNAWHQFLARLATVNVTDAVTVAASNDTGLLRYNGRSEQAAIEALEADVVDSSDEQSTAAVLDKVSGAVLIGARQRQARTQFLAGVVEQLVVETKRARDTEAAAINMQLTTWRDGAAANKALAVGTGDALRTWRQP